MASGSLAVAYLALEALLVSSAACRARFEAADETEAKQRVHFGLALIDKQGDITLDEKRPLAIIVAPEHVYTQDAEGDGVGLVGSGALILMLSDVARAPENHKASELDFVDWTSLVIDEMAAASGVSNQFPARLFRMVEAHHRTPRKDRSAGHDHWTCAYEVRFGALQG